MDRCPEAWIDLAHRLADLARPIAKQYFRTRLDVISKADDSPVTIADRMIEAAMRAEIERIFPDHGILGEEHGSARLDAQAVWVLDPIDGTRAFISGMPVFGTLIACCVEGVPVLGIIDQPIQAERWFGAVGHATTLNGTPVCVSTTQDLAGAKAYTTIPPFMDESAEPQAIERLRQASGMMRYSGDCYQFGLVAGGYADLAVEAGVQAYDYCALVPVIQGAGGVMSDWEGAPLTLSSDSKILASATPVLHAEALKVLAG